MRRRLRAPSSRIAPAAPSWRSAPRSRSRGPTARRGNRARTTPAWRPRPSAPRWRPARASRTAPSPRRYPAPVRSRDAARSRAAAGEPAQPRPRGQHVRDVGDRQHRRRRVRRCVARVGQGGDQYERRKPYRESLPPGLHARELRDQRARERPHQPARQPRLTSRACALNPAAARASSARDSGAPASRRP